MDTPMRYPEPFFQNAGEIAEVDTQQMRADFTIVTSKLNRSGRRIDIMATKKGGGLLLANYAKNPVSYFEHGMHGWPLNLPIGSARNPETGELAINLTKQKATGSVFFSQQSDAAATVFRLYDEGILRGASIMAQPIKAALENDSSNDEADEQIFFHVYEADLMEFGPVGIGADPDAVRQAIGRPWMKPEVAAALQQSLPSPDVAAELAAMTASLSELAAIRQEIGELRKLMTPPATPAVKAAVVVPPQTSVQELVLLQAAQALCREVSGLRTRLGLISKGG